MNKGFAIVGVGDWGSKIVRTISGSASLSLIAAVTSKSDREIQEIAPFDGVIYRDYKDLGDLKGKLDGVIVATPPKEREAIIDYFLDRSMPVFAEKPMTLDASETLRLVGKARRSGTPLVEDFIHLYAWPYITIREQLSATGRIEIESTGGNSGPFRNYSPVFDYGPHDLSMTLQVFRCKPRTLAVEVLDHVSENRFSTGVKLDFGSRGKASLKFGNTFTGKQRVFKCRVNDNEWRYDDSAKDKLEKNGHPYRPDGSFQDYSALELALQCFAGNFSLYSGDECLWLSESVAELTADIVKCIEDYRVLQRPL